LRLLFSTSTIDVQPSEPRFLASLRRYFADFPYLHSSIGQRLLTLETCCGYGYAQEWFSDTRPGLTLLPPGPATSAFHGPAVFPCLLVVGPPICCGVLPDFEPYLGLIPFQGPLTFFLLWSPGLLQTASSQSLAYLELPPSLPFSARLAQSSQSPWSKSVMRKRDLFPGPRPASQRQV